MTVLLMIPRAMQPAWRSQRRGPLVATKMLSIGSCILARLLTPVDRCVNLILTAGFIVAATSPRAGEDVLSPHVLRLACPAQELFSPCHQLGEIL